MNIKRYVTRSLSCPTDITKGRKDIVYSMMMGDAIGNMSQSMKAFN